MTTANKKITTIEDILLATQGSPMERIIHYLVYQDFPEFPEKNDLDKNSKVISSLTLPEKAVFATRFEFVQKVNELIVTHNKIMAELIPEKAELGREKLSKLNIEIMTLSKICADLESLLWTGIEHRLDCEGISHAGNLSGTLDYLIVSSPKNESGNYSFSKIGHLVMFSDAEMYPCETCPKYAKCNLPIKKVR